MFHFNCEVTESESLQEQHELKVRKNEWSWNAQMVDIWERILT